MDFLISFSKNEKKYKEGVKIPLLANIEEAIQLVESGNVEKGLEELNSLQKNATHDEKYTIAECYVNWGLLSEAKELVDELLLLYPDEGQLYILAAEIFIDLENEEEAIDLLHEVKDDDPSYIQSLVLLADLYQLQGLDEVAEKKLLDAKKRAPNEILIDFGLGEFYLSKGEYKKSIPYYRSVLHQEEKIGDRNVHLCLAEALSMSGEFEEAFELYDKGLKDKADLHSLFGFGFAAYQIERYEIAISKWQEVKDIDPEYAGVYIHLAKAYEQEGAVDEALQIAREGIKVDEFNKELFLYAGKLALKISKRAEAESLLRGAITLDPGYIEAVLTLTKLFIHEERFEDVVDCITYSNEFGEYDPHFDWDLGTAKKELELYKDALNHYQNAYNAFKDNVNFLEEYAQFLLEEGMRQDAAKMFKRILTLDPTRTNIEEELIRLEDW